MASSIDIRALRIILAVAESGNMTDASRSLGVTQSAVSQVVQQVEREVGTPLFDRTHRPLSLTASGAVLVRKAKSIVTQTEQLLAAAREMDVLPELRVGLIDSFACIVGPNIVKELRGKARNLKLWTGLTSRLSRDLIARAIDILVCAEEVDDDGELRHVPLFREQFIVALPMRFAALADDLERISRTLPLIRYSARSHTGMQIDRHFRRMGWKLERGLEMDSSESVFAMVSEAVGWAVTTPSCVAHVRPDPARIALLPFPGAGFRREVVLAHRRGEYEEIADLVARVSWDTMNLHIIPTIRGYAPFAADQIVVMSQSETARAV
jgi:DNA-binding transcriptional LysR family regulator